MVAQDVPGRVHVPVVNRPRAPHLRWRTSSGFGPFFTPQDEHTWAGRLEPAGPAELLAVQPGFVPARRAVLLAGQVFVRLASFFSPRRRNRGAAILVPSSSTVKCPRPRSI